jgi:hypothetical protein
VERFLDHHEAELLDLGSPAMIMSPPSNDHPKVTAWARSGWISRMIRPVRSG